MDHADDDDLPVPFGCLKADKLLVVTERSNLGYGRGSRGKWWALTALGALCDEERALTKRYKLWAFPSGIALAVERILVARGRQLTMVDEATFERGVRLCSEESTSES